MPRRARYGVWLAVALIVSLAFLTVAGFYYKFHSYFFAYLVLVACYWISVLVTGSANPLHIAMGADGRLSTSKFQFFIWTGVVVFAYILLFSSIDEKHRAILSRIPTNVLLVMGFSVTTAVGAKGITVSYLNSGQIAKSSRATPGFPASAEQSGIHHGSTLSSTKTTARHGAVLVRTSKESIIPVGSDLSGVSRETVDAEGSHCNWNLDSVVARQNSR